MAELDADRIAAAALAIVDERGAQGLTMRAVAESLGVSAMALYHHVDDKAALVALMIELAFAEEEFPAPTGSGWREDAWEMARSMRGGAHRHPAMMTLTREFRVWTPSMFAVGERWLNIWLQSGLPFEAAATAALASLTAVTGVLQQELADSRSGIPEHASLALLPNLRVALTMPRDADAQYELLVRSIIDGIHARLVRDDDLLESVSEHTAT